MRQEKCDIILSQLRHVYDGGIDKKTGNGKNPTWKGKISFLGGVTEKIYGVEDNSASMGRRNIHYVMPEQNRRQTTRVARANRKAGDIREKREHIQEVFKTYIEYMVSHLPDALPEIPEDLSEEIIALADFSTHARTPTERNYRGELKMVTSIEMPMRMSEQLHLFAQIFAIMYGGEIPQQQKDVIYKVAFDSIPKQKRVALKVLAEYNSVQTRALAVQMNHPTDTARIWLEDLNVLEIIFRNPTKSGRGGVDIWDLKEEYREVIMKYHDIPRKDEDLIIEETGKYVTDVDPGIRLEQERKNAEIKADWGSEQMTF